ncbi:very-long-chain aldehyde decarbonylase CER1-like [Gastrolobium bilobum]|uniref:very-long-chain aldehyde decarbonylase CER1-like n=1 Tax=Gastrolobium bilobum TaxID=150636 RepID=UPI002AB003E2|nr:very-long-chain aldehyde decarbonylase CER1-like [Gastrolobium bilobum]
MPPKAKRSRNDVASSSSSMHIEPPQTFVYSSIPTELPHPPVRPSHVRREPKKKWTVQAIDEEGNEKKIQLTTSGVFEMNGQRIIVPFDTQMQPYGEVATLLSKVCGRIATDCNNVPINYEGWDKVLDSYKTECFKSLKEEETGHTVSRGELYIATHKKKDGSYANDEAKNLVDQIYEELNQSTSSTEISTNDVVAKVFGPEHSGRVRGLGLGGLPSNAFGPTSGRFNPIGSTFSSANSTESSQLKEEVTSLKTKLAASEESLKTLQTFTTLFTGKSSIAAIYGYLFYIDFMNYLGHCNFEFFPKRLFSFFPQLKYLSYTPSFHSLHHTKFRTNYSLFMPMYDYIYGTVDTSTDATYETTLKRPEESADVVHLTHLTTLDSIYQLRIGFASLASNPQTYKCYLRLMWPFTMCYMLMTWICGRTFVLESNTFNDLKLQSWVIPRFKIQYFLKRKSIRLNNLIEEAITEAELSGAKVLSLGLLNQRQVLNAYGELYIQRFPQLKIKIVDGSSLAAATVLNSIPKRTNQVLLRGNFNKVSFAVADALCNRNIQVAVLYKDELKKLKLKLTQSEGSLTLSPINIPKIWLVGDGWDEDEQMKAPKGSLFIPFSHFPPKKMREDCFYHYTPAMITPTTFMNLHSCENWLPRRVMSACRIAGILHALERWNVHECGDTILGIKQVWEASIRHGFQPLKIPID